MDDKKKSLLQAVGGPDMVYLFKHIGKIREENTYAVSIENIKSGISGQTNQAMTRYKLLTQL